MVIAASQLLAGILLPTQAGGAAAAPISGKIASNPSLPAGAGQEGTNSPDPRTAFSLLLSSLKSIVAPQSNDSGTGTLLTQKEGNGDDNANTPLDGLLLPLLQLANNLSGQDLQGTGTGNLSIDALNSAAINNGGLTSADFAQLFSQLSTLQTLVENKLAGETIAAQQATTQNLAAGQISDIINNSGQDQTLLKSEIANLYAALRSIQNSGDNAANAQKGIVIPNVGVVSTPETTQEHQVQNTNPLLIRIDSSNQKGTADPVAYVAQAQAGDITATVSRDAGKQWPGQNLPATPSQSAAPNTVSQAVQQSVTQASNIASGEVSVQPYNKVQENRNFALQPTVSTKDGTDSQSNDTGAPNILNAQGKPFATPFFSLGAKAYAQLQGDTKDTVSIQALTASKDKLLLGENIVSGSTTGGADAVKYADMLGRQLGQPQQLAAASPWEQVAMQVVHSAKEGKHKISLQLEPASLGKIDVRMDFHHDGKTSIVVAVDKPETLELLQRDARQLQQSLSDAGIKTDMGSLSFNLRGEGGFQQGQFAEAFSQNQGAFYKDNEEQQTVTPVIQATLAVSGRTDGIDIRV